MPKRKSGGGENEAEKKTNTKRLSAQQLEKFPRVPKMVQWFLARTRLCGHMCVRINLF